MRREIALLVAFTVSAATSASGQFVDNGGEAGSADTSAFGQSAEFSNVTTTFDGIELQVLRLIRDAKEDGTLRLVGQFVSSNPEFRWVQMYNKGPRLVDDLGNTFWLTSWSGIDACRDDGSREDFRWMTKLEDCAGEPGGYTKNNVGDATLVAPGVPVSFSLIFSPIDPEAGIFDSELAKLATSITASFSFVVAVKSFDTLERGQAEGMVKYQVVVPRIPVPQE